MTLQHAANINRLSLMLCERERERERERGGVLLLYFGVMFVQRYYRVRRQRSCKFLSTVFVLCQLFYSLHFSLN